LLQNFKGIKKDKAILTLCFEGSHVLRRTGDVQKQIGASYSRLGGEYLTVHTTTPNLISVVCALFAKWAPYLQVTCNLIQHQHTIITEKNTQTQNLA